MIIFKEAPKTDFEAPKLLRVKPGPPLRVVLLNRKYVGLDTHYWGGHTVNCPGDKTCKACRSGLFPVWSGFIFVSAWEGGRVAVLALTPVMGAMLTMTGNGNGSLLGMRVIFRRKTKQRNSGVLTEFAGVETLCDEQHEERLINRVRIIFKDYVIEDSGEPNSKVSP
jgi:hypothetical protein